MPSYTQYMRQMAVMDASDDDIESWITVKGNHIPIKKGQSKEEAVKEFISKKSDKEFSKRAEKPQSIGEATKKVVSQVKENREINKAAKKDPWEKKANTGYGEALRRGKNSKKISEAEAEEYRQYQQSPEFATKTFEQYKADTEKPKNTFLSNPNTLKEFANHFGISESAAKNAAEKYGDEFYNTMVKDPMKGVGMAVGGEKSKSEKAKKENGRYERPVHISEPLKDVVSETKAKMEKKEPTAAEKHTTTRNLLTMFGKHYDDLYEGKTKRNPALVKEFDDKMANDPEFKKQVQAFVRERGDLLTSDREVEAYMLAYNTVKNKLEPANKKLEEYHKKDTETKEPHYFHKWTIESEKPHNLTNEQIQEKLNFYRFVRSNGRSDDNELLDKIHDLSDELERRKK